MLIFLYFPKGESNLLISGLGNYCTAQELRQKINPLFTDVFQRQHELEGMAQRRNILQRKRPNTFLGK